MMKKLLSIGLMALIILPASSQTIKNYDFEAWTQKPYSIPENYKGNNERVLKLDLEAITEKVTGKNGYALKLTTRGGSEGTGFVGTIEPDSPPPWTGGWPYTETPDGFGGYYKCDIPPGDSAIIALNFSKAGSNIGVFMKKISGTVDNFTPFYIPFSLGVAPDSLIVLFTSSDALRDTAVVGSTITLDSIYFTNVTSQPANLNGEFETWLDTSTMSIDSWTADMDYNNSIKRSSDAFSGDYAVEIITIEDKNDYGSRAYPERLNNYKYDYDCDCNTGGFAYSEQIDTLMFWYKYAPASVNDTAYINLDFLKDGSNIGGYYKDLIEATSYTQFKFPFDLAQAPDTVRISFSSGQWEDSTLASVGSSLIVDALIFASEIQDTVDTPVFDSSAVKTYLDSLLVSISVDTVDALIYYTLNGADPSDNSTLYSEPFVIYDTTTIKAIAYKNDLIPSDIATIKYNIDESLSSIKQIPVNQINIYPNPVGNTIFIEGVTNPEIVLYSISGSVVIDKTISDGKIDVTNIKPGIYILKVNQHSSKIVIQ